VSQILYKENFNYHALPFFPFAVCMTFISNLFIIVYVEIPVIDTGLSLHTYHLPVHKTTEVATDVSLYDATDMGKKIGCGAYGRVLEVGFHIMPCVAKFLQTALLQYPQSEEVYNTAKTNFLKGNIIFHLCIAYFSGKESLYHVINSIFRLLVIVMETMQHNLEGLLENSSKVKLFILDQTYSCVRYLHSINSPIMHRDITTNNSILVLLGGHLDAKVTEDVAMLMQVDSRDIVYKIPDFIPPESLINSQVYDHPFDTFFLVGVIFNARQWLKASNAIQLSHSSGTKVILHYKITKGLYLLLILCCTLPCTFCSSLRNN